MPEIPTQEREWSIQELSRNKSFPYKESMIRTFIKDGRLKAKFYSAHKIRIPQSSIDTFLKKIELQNNKK